MNPQYIVLYAETPELLSEVVNKAISDKWQLVGGICALALGESTQYCQALFRVTPITSVASIAKKVM